MKNGWKLLLSASGERTGFKVARTPTEACVLVKEFGPPRYIELDYKLGKYDNAMSFLRWLMSGPYYSNPPAWSTYCRNEDHKDEIDSFMRMWWAVL
tara:strand:- start:1063 stop:1350 length:288 start_codon:yes stop_codon:yes gene_type:complete